MIATVRNVIGAGIGAFISIGIMSLFGVSHPAAAISSSDFNVSLDPAPYSLNSYPNKTIPMKVIYTPRSSDLNKEISISPIVSRTALTNSNGELADSEDITFADSEQIVTPKTTNPIEIIFNPLMIQTGDNYMGCFSYRVEQFDGNDDDYAAVCENSIQVKYTGTLLPVYRFYSDNFKSHFYTINLDESINVSYNPDWRQESFAYNAHSKKQAGTTELYRFWSKNKKAHFYTTSIAERDQVISRYSDNEWKYEKIAYYVAPYSGSCDSETKPVFRFYSKKQKAHFYTINVNERDQIIQKYPVSTWRYEGPRFCAWQ